MESPKSTQQTVNNFQYLANMLKKNDLDDAFGFHYWNSLSTIYFYIGLKAASFDKLAVVSLAATKWYLYMYVWIQMELFICLYVLLMCMYVHLMEIKYQSIRAHVNLIASRIV